jgi:hypothetical protein
MLDAIDQDILERQTRRYGGHEFTTLTGEPIFVSERMSLAEAVDLHTKVAKQLSTAEFTGHFIRPHEENQQLIADLRKQVQVAHAEAMAAFYRAAQCWPKDARGALGF